MKKLLIIEDDQIVANIYRNKFSVEGYQVEIANDGEEGINAVRSFGPDAILLDLMLPKMSGLDLIKNIRSEASTKQVPIVVFSNTYLTNMVQDAWKAGATKCLSKANCSPKQVVEAIRGTLSNGHATANEARHTPATQNGKPLASTDSPAGDHAALFVRSLPATLNVLRGLVKNLIRASDTAASVTALDELYRRVHALTGNAALSGISEIAQLSDALEALLKELQERPDKITSSVLRTIAGAVDCFALLFERPGATPGGGFKPAIMVVDDEAISRRAVASALDRAKLKCSCMEDPAAAYKVLQTTRHDLIFLDVDMPGMNGYELCTKLRQLPVYRKTPIVFVTGLSDLEARANSMMSGGNDFITKPFLFMELAVKALVHVQRSRSALR